jgi:hypothetical protein
MPSSTRTAGGEKFDTFTGVIRPTLLTTLGALLFLREGWLVGNSGLIGALVVILSAYVITGTTALAVSSLSTNVRVQAGGAFALIARALGLEAGGAIGIPLYGAQCASAGLYLFAFGEVWLHMFPGHPIGLVVFVAYLGVGALTLTSAKVAFRAQGPLMLLIGLAILSAWFGGWEGSTQLAMVEPVPARVSLREAFAVFFPAATGLMVGVGMSGSLSDPRRSIPKGILTAWAVSLAVYLITAVWCTVVASPDELLMNKTVMISKAAFGPMVLVGVLCATVMAAVSSLVAAPRLLQAMAGQRVVPMGAWLEASDARGEPRRALWVSMGVAGLCLFSGSLDQIAQIVTAFFILTYLAINLVVFLEQRLSMISFRPTMAVHPSIPLIGLIACALGLFVSSPTMGLVGGTMVAVVYIWLHRRRLHTPWETVRSGIHVRVAAWAAQRASRGPRPERAWSPELLLPVERSQDADLLVALGARITRLAGGVRIVGMRSDADLGLALEERAAHLRAHGTPATSTVVDAVSFARGATMVVDATQGMFMGPNLLLINGEVQSEKDLQILVDHCDARGIGMGVYLSHPDGGLGRARQVTVWLSERSPDWSLQMHNANLDLPVLIGHLLSADQGCRLQLATVVRSIEDRADANGFLERLIEQGRLKAGTDIHVAEGRFLDAVRESPYADIHVFGLSTTVERKRMFQIRDAVGGSCLFLLDSGQESILA